MRLIKPSFEIWEQEPGIQGIYKAIERASRVCYKSEDKITEDSAKPFVDRIVKNHHLAMLEHGTVYLKAPLRKDMSLPDAARANPLEKYLDNPYSRAYVCEDGAEKFYAVTTNYRVIVENDWLDDLKYLCEPIEYHDRRICVHFTADIGVMREFFRHRTMSMAQESTRYCNYSKEDKFGGECTFILPVWMNEDVEKRTKVDSWFMASLAYSEAVYIDLVKNGWSPQQARGVLPLATKSEAVMTGFADDWRHFFSLRALGTTGAPHPQARELAEPLYEEFLKRGLIAVE